MTNAIMIIVCIVFICVLMYLQNYLTKNWELQDFNDVKYGDVYEWSAYGDDPYDNNRFIKIIGKEITANNAFWIQYEREDGKIASAEFWVFRAGYTKVQ